MAGATAGPAEPRQHRHLERRQPRRRGRQLRHLGSGTGQTIKDLSGVAGSTVQLGGNALTVGTANSTTFAGIIDDGGNPGGSLVKQGSGTLTLTGTNTYSGGTTISGGMINFNAANNFGTGTITLNGGGLQWAAGSTADISSRLAPLGAGGGTFDTNGNTITFATGLTGTGGLTKQGAGHPQPHRHQHLHRSDRR